MMRITIQAHRICDRQDHNTEKRAMSDVPWDQSAPRDYAAVARPNHHSRKILPYKLIEKWAVLTPDKPALISQDITLTYRDLMTAAETLADGLAAIGVKAGQAVVVILENRWEHIPLFLALARLGGVHVTLSTTLSEDALDAELAEIRPTLIIGRRGVTIESVSAAATGRLPELFHDEDAPLRIRHSSGTTGRPKKTLGSQRSGALASQELASMLGLTEADIHLATGSLAHAALQMGLTQLTVGGTMVVHPFDPATFWIDCERFGITNLMLMPTMLTKASEYAGAIDRPLTIFTAGATLPAPTKRRLTAMLPSLRLYDLYSATEAGHVACLRPNDQHYRPTSAGRAYFSTEIGIFDKDGQPVAPGEVGDIYARGPMATYAYLGAAQPLPSPPSLTQEGWLRLGDMGHLDDEGYLFISDRSADVFEADGVAIFPSEIENIIREFEGVSEVAVIGVPDDVGRLQIHAYIEGACDIDAITAGCKTMPETLRPKLCVHVENLPRTASAKVSRHLLRERLKEA